MVVVVLSAWERYTSFKDLNIDVYIPHVFLSVLTIGRGTHSQCGIVQGYKARKGGDLLKEALTQGLT